MTAATRAVSLFVTALAVAATLSWAGLHAQARFEPTVGQEGKDVIWVPTPDALVERMLDMVRLTPADSLIDLGSGDGRTVIAAAKRGARARGVEYNEDMVRLSRANAVRGRVESRAEFVKADLFETDLSHATVISMFLLPELNLRLRPRILALEPGTRVVSNTFTMGDWVADETATIGSGCSRWCTALLWIVPARVEGTWRSARGELRLEQDYQFVSGTLTSDRGPLVITNGLLRGGQLAFTVDASRYAGRVLGNVITGSISSGGRSEEWKAERVAR